MPDPVTSELPKPKSWDEFEDIVWDIYKRKWNDPNAQRYGRPGQAQQGVDIYGKPEKMGGATVGIQCKRYKKLDLETIKEEVEKAEAWNGLWVLSSGLWEQRSSRVWTPVSTPAVCM